MHISLSPQLEAFIQSKVDSGFYSNGSEVVRDALRHLYDEEQEKLDQLNIALQEGLDSGRSSLKVQDIIVAGEAST